MESLPCSLLGSSSFSQPFPGLLSSCICAYHLLPPRLPPEILLRNPAASLLHPLPSRPFVKPLTTPKGANNILFKTKSLLPWDELRSSPRMVNWMPSVHSVKSLNSRADTHTDHDIHSRTQMLILSLTTIHSYVDVSTHSQLHVHAVCAHTFIHACTYRCTCRLFFFLNNVLYLIQCNQNSIISTCTQYKKISNGIFNILLKFFF